MTNFCFIKLLFLAVLIKICSSKVIIIGTGPSGIAAATKLLKNNVSDILILEAENRIGGRINSIEFGDAFVDMGAEWCHGQEDNIVYSLIKDYNILRHTATELASFYSDGKQVDETLNKQLFDIIEDIYVPDGNKKQREGISLGEYCMNRYFTAIDNLNLTDSRNQTIAYDFIDFFQSYVDSSEGAFTWTKLEWVGYKTILDLLMQKFPNSSIPLPIDDKIIFNKQVQKIVWDSKDDNVIVKCLDGSWYHGDHVIFTPSLGVLKEKHGQLFEPQLPLQKQNAIEKLGIGAVMKIMLLFDKPWWPNTFTGASFIWSVDHKNSNNFHKFTKLGRTWIFDVLGVIPVANNPNVLSFWFTGKSIPIIEQLDNVDVLEGVNFLLQTFLGSTYNLTYPITITK
ncbi:flavin monoamine oxidase [Holotrichia oblita]|uniref:Flavin monoamine oxidase n=1 Tax=Holotrichia oblita TaxID=644536 RepID=A0ACB9TNN3_HOLOL|nr:flavin monoamine oxidase [Holotrichia oblita]